MARKSKLQDNLKTAGVGSYLQPGATLAPVTTNLPDQAISVAAQINQFNALQPTQCYEMSVPVRRAITAIVNEASLATWRIFTKNGDEVIGGELFNLINKPATNWSTKRFTSDIMSFHLISGEIAISLLLDEITRRPVGMLPLAPNRLYPIDPTTPREISDIKTWQYTYNDGMIGQIPNTGYMPKVGVQFPSECVIFAPNFNTISHVRGLSPLITGVNAATVNYQALRYKKDFFTNNAVPSHIIVLEEKLSEKQRKDWEQRYLEQYSTFNNQSQKVIVSSGTSLKIEKLESDMKDDGMIQLMNYSINEIAMLFAIPPTVMGLWERVRFETAAIERTQFLESTVLPVINTVQDVMQYQLIDRFFSLSKPTRGKSILPMSKSLKDILQKRLSNNVDSEYVLVLDPSSIPLMSQINTDKFTALESLCLKGHLSVNEAAERLNIELPYNSLRDKIFIPNTLQELTENMGDDGVLPLNDEANEEVEQIEHSNNQQKQTKAETDKQEQSDPDTQKKVKSLHNQYRIIRKQVLINNENGTLYSLSEVDNLCKELYVDIPEFKKEVRKDLFYLKSLVKDKTAEERAAGIKAYYNQKKPSYLRNLVDGH